MAEATSPSGAQVTDSVAALGVQTRFDHEYRRYARLLRDCIVSGRVTPESIVRTAGLRDSLRTEMSRITAEKFGQWDRNQQVAFVVNFRNVLLLSVAGLDLTDTSLVVVTSRTVSLQSLDMEMAQANAHDPRLAIAMFSAIPSGPAWSTEPLRSEQLDSTLAERWRDYLNHPEVLTINSAQRRISVNRWLSEFCDRLPSDWASTSRYVHAEPEIAPLLAFLWSIADAAMKTRLEQTDQWTLTRPPQVMRSPQPSPAVPSSVQTSAPAQSPSVPD